jgi:chitin disaccharide deacetylase
LNPNPVLKKLGFSNHDRIVIIHADDIGMCHASIHAFTELVEFGLISSGAAMTTCSWFPQVASFCRQSPNVDMGVHLTLTSEWNNYRWSPISTSDRNSGLIDSEGYLFRTSEEAQSKGDPNAVKLELQSQLNRVISAGIEVTHLDTHMNTVAHPKFINGYIQMAIDNKIPFLFPRLDKDGFRQLELAEDVASMAADFVNILEDQGIPLVDNASGLTLIDHTNRFEQAEQKLSSLPSGITHFIIHPSIDTVELRAITPDWQCRVADYHTFMNDDLRKYIKNIGLQIIGYRSLKELL